MWVGGEFLFDPENPLRFGDNVQFEETVERVKSLNHNETIFVDYNRRYVNEAGLSQVEKRRICYLYGLYSEEERASPTDTIRPDEYKWITLSKVTNFRMSALTFNSHLLHYDESYCKEVEGYPKVVVQAPLLFEIALQFWLNRAGKGKDVKRIKYKVSRPVFVDQQVKVCFKEMDGRKWKLWLEDSGGETLSMLLTERPSAGPDKTCRAA
ncbi:DEKNAAC105460 [Brettanomyces naardenensis]|uniref:DEKNAAC105460 n=1 Tax=Brettanomyces naardenensis TaxID=13370 RepID=A0A448YTK5_BRENA|nr:DEKNAAC105460 [Brettanomyces naardenensis]